MLRGALVLAGLWLCVRLLPGMPDAAVAVMVVALAALIALPGAWAASVRRGHALAMLSEGGQARRVLAGPVLRILLAGLPGLGAAVLLVLRLLEAGPVFWVLAALILPLTWAAIALLARRLATEAAGLHRWRLAHLWARLLAVGAMLALAVVLAMAVPAPVPAPGEVSGGAFGGAPGGVLSGVLSGAPLVAEALALARLWAGLEGFALGQAAEFGGWGRGLAALVSLSALAGAFWALATLAVAVTLPVRAVTRALGPASEAPVPPATGRTGSAMALGLAVLVVLAAILGGRHLGALPPEARPSGQVELAVEVIGGAFHAAGTRARIEALRTAALAEDAAVRDTLRGAMAAGFDAMEANVEPFLDDFYSLSGEYGRLIRWASGSLEAHMTRQLTQALQDGAPFAAFEAAQARALAEAETRVRDLALAETAILAETRIEGMNPARLRITGRHGALPLPPGLLAADLGRAQLRWGVSAGAGVVAVAMAQRVVAGLARRGLMATAGRVILRAGGLLLAFGVDYALVKLDEYHNRDGFRDAILAEISVQRAAALAVFD